MKKTHYNLIILVVIAALLFGGVFLLKTGTFGTKAIFGISGGGTWLLPLVAVSALIDSINPCAFSILLLTIAFLFSLGKLRTKIVTIGGIYILGIFVVYMLIGLGILQTLHLFNTPHFMAKVGATLLILLGAINLINEYVPRFPVKLGIPKSAHYAMARLMEKSSLPTAFILGILVGLCEFPCTGGPYVMVLGLLHDHATYLKGVLYLILYNLIFVLPLIIILLIGADKLILDKLQDWKKEHTHSMRLWGAIIMIILGFLIFAL